LDRDVRIELLADTEIQNGRIDGVELIFFVEDRAHARAQIEAVARPIVAVVVVAVGIGSRRNRCSQCKNTRPDKSSDLFHGDSMSPKMTELDNSSNGFRL